MKESGLREQSLNSLEKCVDNDFEKLEREFEDQKKEGENPDLSLN